MFKLTPAGSIPVCPNVGQSIAGILFLFLASFLAPCNANAQTISGVDLCDSEGGTWQPNFPGLSWREERIRHGQSCQTNKISQRIERQRPQSFQVSTPLHAKPKAKHYGSTQTLQVSNQDLAL